MHHAELHPAAIEDLNETTLWFDAQGADLLERFEHAFEAQLQRILEQPQLYNVDEDGLRRVLVRGFKYHIGFLIRGEAVLIIGVIHGSRHPGVWTAGFHDADE